MTFRRSPTVPAYKRSHDDFVEEPLRRAMATAEPEPKAESTDKPWDGFSKKDKPAHNVTVRLNEHYMARLRYLAEQNEDLSMQQILRKMLLPELEKRTSEAVSS
jgi:hypothetical protein